ncbi:YncE family protein [Balneola sp. MJW-20]|uniref:YncE family protein n=1 Tax=Gracilimonas aurantiaca TaxID=3234185 RepID=UPI003465EF2A
MYRNLIPAALLMLFMLSCENSTNTAEPELASVYVLNEGNFGSANSSITSYDPETGQVQQGIFTAANNRPAGDLLQSVTRIDDRLFMVVNNSHTIEVVEAENFSSIATIRIANEASPRNFIPVTAEKGYVTNLYGNSVSVIDLNTYVEESVIPVGENPEGIARVGDRVYVANSGLGNGNTLSVIDALNDVVTDTIVVGDNPVAVTADSFGRVWVVCVGAYGDFSDPEDDTPGEVYIFNGEEGTLIKKLFIGGHPGELTIDAELGKAYLISDNVIEIDATSLEITNRSFIDRGFYAIGLSTFGDEPYLWTTDPLNYIQAGKAIRYDLSGVAVDSFETGIIPGGFYFASEK